MYYSSDSNYVYRNYGGSYSPVREVRSISEAEARRIDREEKAIREAERYAREKGWR